MNKIKNTIEITLERASLINVLGTQYNEAHPEISKDTFAIQRILNQTNKPKPFEAYTDGLNAHNAKLENIDMKYASTESAESPKLLLDEKGNKIYTAAADEKRNNEILAENKRWREEKENLLSRKITVETHIVDVKYWTGANVSMEFIDTFDGIVLSAEDLYEQLLKDAPAKPVKAAKD